MKDIVISKLNISYPGKTVLKNFDAVFPAGSRTAIMGPSGCGKTTLIKYLLGLNEADSGSAEGIPDRLSAVFQEDRLCEDYSALKNVALVCSTEEAEKCLNTLGLPEEEIHKPVRELSGGQKRRVSIARALVADSELVIMDEPFKGLDEDNKRSVIYTVAEYTVGKTFIMITHDAQEAELLGAEIMHLQGKRDPYKTVSVKTMRDSDAWTIAHGTPSRELMKRAGKAIFEAGKWKAPVAIVCGKGNNAGDGYVAANYFIRNGIDCTIIRIADVFSGDGQFYHDKCLEAGIESVLFSERRDLSSYGSILDCLLGTGYKGDVIGMMKDMIDEINRCHELGAYVVSADINSGLNGDTGLGGTYVKSDLTVSIGSFKTGHFTGYADAAMKAKVNCDIGIRIIE